jgi:hypothetical protein
VSLPPTVARRPRPPGGRCDACHQRQPRVQRTRDELITICSACARGVDVAAVDAGAAIMAVVGRSPAGERRQLERQLRARLEMHAARRARRPSRPAAPQPGGNFGSA